MRLFDRLFGNKKKADHEPKFLRIDYNRYFDNTIINNIPLELLDLGELNLPTGQIIACDPLVFLYDSLPFTKTVPPGKYPVVACIARTGKSGDRYAIVKLEFSEDRVVKWEMALTENDNIKDLKKAEEYFGFPVDAGLGCLCDVKTQQMYNLFAEDFMQRNPEGNIYDDYFDPEFRKNAVNPSDPADAGDWLNFYLPNHPDLNVIMFHSGYGDGSYPCYWGKNSEDKICCLVVDFQVL